MINLRKKSIATIVVIILVIIASTFLVTIGITSYKIYKDNKWKEFNDFSYNLADLSAKSLALPLWNFDRNQIGQISEGIMRDQSVFAIVVRQINPDRIIQVKGRDSGWKIVDMNNVPGFDGMLSSVQTIHIPDEDIGTIEVVITPKFLESHLKNIRIGIIFIIAALALVLILVLYLLLWHIVLKPLKQLEHFALQVSKGEVNISYSLKTPFIGELENLRTSISAMIVLLESRYGMLQQEIKHTRESENLFRILNHSIPDLVWLKDPDGIYLSCNPTFEKLYGAKECDIIGKTDYDFVEPELADSFREFDTKVMTDGKTSTNEEWVTFASDHHHALLETVKVPMTDISGNLIGVLGISRDITEKKRVENELEKHRNNLELLVRERTIELASANEKLTSAFEALLTEREKLQTALDELHALQKQLIHSEKMASVGLLSAGIAHEINNPLNFIKGGILGIEDYFETNLKDHIDEVELFITSINTGIKRASEIVSSLSHYSRRDDLKHQECDIHSIIDNCLIMLQNQMRGKVMVTKKYTEKRCLVSGSEGKLHQAFLNIISNAEQAIENTGTIEIGSEVHQNMVVLTITDSGYGISPDNIPKIFDPFFTTKVVGKGTGLGLSITYNIIQEHNGSISYLSNPGSGTIVTINLPISKTDKL